MQNLLLGSYLVNLYLRQSTLLQLLGHGLREHALKDVVTPAH